MADVGDRVSVASKSGPRLGVVISTSGSMLRVRWESGEETGLVPAPGTLTVLGKARGASVKKAPVKKAPAKKAPVKKAPVKKAPVKKAPVKKAPVKKAPVKKTARRTR